MDNNSNFAVHDLTIREAPQLGDVGGAVIVRTVVRFSVGTHGPFTIIYDGRPNAAQVSQDVTARVNELRQLAGAMTSLNQRSG